MKTLSLDFFARDTVLVAQELLGKIISVHGVFGRIVETEAYTLDAASHAFCKTPRSSLMFDTYGCAYVYFIYGMYHCLNFTTEKNSPGAVLIRAVEPLNISKEDIYNLCNGPGKLCRYFQIDLTFNGSLVGDKISLFDDGFVPVVGKSSRIGIRQAKELEWRFFILGNRFLSKKS